LGGFVKKTVKKGFTLIELVVVLAIIAALAGLVIPQVSMLGRTTDMAASASNQAELANNLQLFFVLQKRYPQGLDSLLDTTGALYSSDTTDANTQTKGLPYSGADNTRLQDQLFAGSLTNVTGTAEYLRSFSRAGFDWVHDHDTALVNSNNSSTATQRLTSGSPFLVAEVRTPFTTPAAAGATPLWSKLSPTLLANERLVAVGIGPRNTGIGKTMLNSPIYNGCDGKYYGRYIAIFKIYPNGERAVLVGVIDSYGRTPDYTQQQYNESLPDGARQG
jgi:prepilin-type N-terminal cleavage/methylation domain-containing protein